MDLFSFLRREPAAAHILTGKRGEATAVRFLRRTGYKILQCNIRVGKKDEIDILAFDPEDKVLVFAEVKTRTRENDYEPDLNVTAEKRFAMDRAARRWMALHCIEIGYRFDVICVVDGKVTAHHKEVDVQSAVRAHLRRQWRR